MKQAPTIAIAGAGPAGLATAALLASQPLSRECKLVIIDAGAEPTWSADEPVGLRVSAMAAGSVELLRKLDAWDPINAARACAYEGMRVWDETDTAGSRSTLAFDAAEFAVPALGYIVENELLRTALLQTLQASPVRVLFDQGPVELRTRGRRFDLVGSELELAADLVIAADGARSALRESAGIETRTRHYGQIALVTHLDCEQPHQNIAWQRFLRSGPLGLLPLGDGRVSSVWTVSEEAAARLQKLDDAEFGAAISEASDYVLGALSVAAPRASFPLVAQHAARYALPGLVLLGDAAHSIHPLAGQGANLGLRDAQSLAATIEAALERGEDPADLPVLRRYERARKGDNALMLHSMSGLNGLFSAESGLVRGLTRTGMRWFNRSGPLREHIVKVALGSSTR